MGHLNLALNPTPGREMVVILPATCMQMYGCSQLLNVEGFSNHRGRTGLGAQRTAERSVSQQ